MAFGKMNLSLASQAANQEEGDRKVDSRIWVVPEEGQFGVFFLPPLQGEQLPWVQYFVHYNLGQAVTCLQSYGEQCPICLENQRLYKAGQAGDRIAADLSKAIYKRASYLFNIIPWVTWQPLNPPVQTPNGLAMCQAVFKQPVGEKTPKNITSTGVKIYRGGEKVIRQLSGFIPFNGDFTDMTCGNIISMNKVRQTGKNGQAFFETLCNIYPQKAMLSPELMEAAKTGMINLRTFLAESKRTPAEMQSLLDAKIAEARAGQSGQASVPPLSQPVYMGTPTNVVAPPPPAVITKPQTVTGAVPTVPPTAFSGNVSAAPVDPLAAFEQGLK